MQIAKNSVVTLDYVLTDDSGETIDSSKSGGPLSYIHGTGSIVKGLEAALEGKGRGDRVQVVVEPAEGFGERDEELVHVAERSQFDADADIEVGQQVGSNGPSGEQVFTVIEVDEDEVTLDGNHPLAGVTLHFDVTVIDVRDASLEELRHGHAHGPGGHHH